MKSVHVFERKGKLTFKPSGLARQCIAILRISVSREVKF